MKNQKWFSILRVAASFSTATALKRSPYSPGERKEGSTPPWNVELVKRTRPQLYSKRWPAPWQPSFILCRFYGPAVPRSRHYSTLHELLPWRHAQRWFLMHKESREVLHPLNWRYRHIFASLSASLSYLSIYRTVLTDWSDSEDYWESMWRRSATTALAPLSHLSNSRASLRNGRTGSKMMER